MAQTILEKIKAYKLVEISEKKKVNPASKLRERITDENQKSPFLKAILNKEGKTHSIIAEIKKASPSKGVIRENFDPLNIAKEYERGGASCISVLTDGPSFMGSEKDLIEVKSASNLPILRKDFIFDEYQLLESKVIGADCVLLILSALDFSQARDLEDFALLIGLEVLIEIHNKDELSVANDMKSPLIGINNRNLHTFKTDTSLTKDLAPYLKPKKTLISESGLSNRIHLDELAKIGTHGFLMGETLMKCNNITAELNHLVK
tara:strand:- start:964 stop:1752 length:789 start_codon:yes stop_codon:yes gene_type:complete